VTDKGRGGAVITRGCTGLISWPYICTSRLIRKARIRLRGAWHTGKADLLPDDAAGAHPVIGETFRCSV
jgi:hypothetical protein